MFYESKLNPCQQITSWSSDHTCRTCSDSHLCHLFVNICISYVATLIKIFTEQPLGHVALPTLLSYENCRRWFSEYEIEWTFDTLDVYSVLWMLALNLHIRIASSIMFATPFSCVGESFLHFEFRQENKVRSKCHTNMRFWLLERVSKDAEKYRNEKVVILPKVRRELTHSRAFESF